MNLTELQLQALQAVQRIAIIHTECRWCWAITKNLKKMFRSLQTAKKS